MRKNTRLCLLTLSILVLSFAATGLVREARAVSGQASLVATVTACTLPPPPPANSTETPGLDPDLPPAVTESPALDSLVASSISFPTLGFEGLNQTIGGANPPDVTAAAGPSHVLEMVNFAGQIWTKDGASVCTFRLSSLFSSGSDFIFDPKVLYDFQSGRWFASVADDNRDSIRVGVSASNDPTGTWRIYNVPAGSGLPDQPIIGVSDDKFIVSTNDFQSIFGGFLGAHYFILNKGQMTSGASLVDFVAFGPDRSLASVHPVQSASSTTTQYMVSTFVGGSTLWLFAVTGVPPGTVTVTITQMAIRAIPQPPRAIQPGTTNRINTDDARVQTAAWFQGKLWFGLSAGCTPSGDSVQRSCLRLMQINTATTTITQDFDFGISGQYNFYPALRIDNNSNLAVVFGFSSASIFPSIGVTGQAFDDPAGSLMQPDTVKAGTTFEPTGRYGDYFGAGIDPTDPTVIWVAGQYRRTTTAWTTFITPMRVAGFTISSSPTSLSLTVGNSGSSAISLKSKGGFSGTVNLRSGVTSGPATTTARIVIDSTAQNDPNLRNHGLTVDKPLPTYFWTDLTGSVIGTASGVFHYDNTFTLTVGSHFLEYGVSAFVGSWHAKIYVNGVLLGETDTDVNNHVRISFNLGSGPTTSLSLSQIFLGSGGTGSSTLTVSTTSSTPLGTYTVTATGDRLLSSQLGMTTRSAKISLSVTSGGCGCGGGSVAYGSLITMADGSKVPVQNLKVGDQLLGYDTSTGQFTVAVIDKFIVVDTTNMLVISTETGMPLRVDANPAQTVWARWTDGNLVVTGWMSVTRLSVGDFMFHQDLGWVEVTSIQFAPEGRHVMFDIISTLPYFADGYLDPPVKV